ncbi:chorismate synthase [Gehongia tenuis]|uniref:Chorismate synthase n=1 Tax=Gehongia tenuis TaxID=2763655 RepID=A0A926D4N1_9FIRM|nr:chorismate synthase [Gehongia tenuis]MBC8531282.1 chorismate synthase [Gehongia tenuis]
MNTWGQNVRLSIFGESHGPGLGVVIDGLPAGFRPDWTMVKGEMARRAPGGELATERQEGDEIELISGVLEGTLTGAPLCGLIRNKDMRSQDYSDMPFRPSHADYAAFHKFHGFNDPRGGGHFSGRITAGLTFAGALAKQLLAQKGIEIGAQITAIGRTLAPPVTPDQLGERLAELRSMRLPCLNEQKANAMAEEILAAKRAGDSVGGRVEAFALGLPVGLGEPFFDSVESVLSHLFYAIPAVKGVVFGDGLEMGLMRGSDANDAMSGGERVKILSNHNGGVTGGLTNGAPLRVTLFMKPTPTIGREQQTVNAKGESVVMRGRGRHDPCVVPRAVPVIEAAMALGLLDLMGRYEG